MSGGQALPHPTPSPPDCGPVLSPVPTEQGALQVARDYLAAAIGMEAVGTQKADPSELVRLDGLMAMASAMVEREAPGAPQAIKNEAVIRLAGYARQSDFGAIQAEAVGPQSVEYTRASHAAMFRRCGAMGLLSGWKVRRAGAIG